MNCLMRLIEMTSTIWLRNLVTYLLQVMLHAQIGEDDGMFSIEDVIESISKKWSAAIHMYLEM